MRHAVCGAAPHAHRVALPESPNLYSRLLTSIRGWKFYNQRFLFHLAMKNGGVGREVSPFAFIDGSLYSFAPSLHVL